MSSEATARALGTSPELQTYRTRDEFFRAYNPVTPEERLLVIEMANAWTHLESVREMRADILARRTLADLFENDREGYKLIQRGIAEAERMWRHAVVMFERVRRRREGRQPARHISTGRPRPAAAPVVEVPVRAAGCASASTATSETEFHSATPLPHNQHDEPCTMKRTSAALNRKKHERSRT